METKVLNYRIIITPEKMNGRTVYNAYSPSLGVADWGKTPELAISHIKDAIECHLGSFSKNNEPIPIEETSDFLISMTTVSLPSGFTSTFI